MIRRGVLEMEGGGRLRALLADTWPARLRGLLFRQPLALDGSEAFLLKPCASVHAFGMRYPLDLVFLDGNERVCGWRQALKPWQAAACRGARATVELRGGSLEQRLPKIGERWRWIPVQSSGVE